MNSLSGVGIGRGLVGAFIKWIPMHGDGGHGLGKKGKGSIFRKSGGELVDV